MTNRTALDPRSMNQAQRSEASEMTTESRRLDLGSQLNGLEGIVESARRRAQVAAESG